MMTITFENGKTLKIDGDRLHLPGSDRVAFTDEDMERNLAGLLAAAEGAMGLTE
jgi:hypothetical protein